MGLFDALYLGSELVLMEDLPFYSTVTSVYASVQQFVDRLGATKASELTADSGTTPDEAKLLADLQEAEGEVNRYLAKRVQVPVDLTAHPELASMLRGLTLDIAVYRVHTRRPPVPEDHKTLYENAIKALIELAKNESTLPAATTPASNAADEPTYGYGGSESDWNRENF